MTEHEQSATMAAYMEKCDNFAQSMAACQQALMEQHKLNMDQHKTHNVSSGGRFSIFNGEKQNFSDYLVHFNTVCELRGLNVDTKQNERKLLLVSNLAGSALEFIQTLNWSSLQFDQVVDQLKARFDTDSLRCVGRSKFAQYSKTKSLTWMEVLQDLRGLANKAFPGYGELAMNDLLCNKLLDLVSDSALKGQLMWADIQTPLELVEKILLWEAVQSSDSHKVVHKVQKLSVEDKVDHLYQAVEHLSQSVRQLSISSAEIATFKATPRPSVGMTKRRCFVCGDLTHIRANCPFLYQHPAPNSRFTYATRPRYQHPPRHSAYHPSMVPQSSVQPPPNRFAPTSIPPPQLPIPTSQYSNHVTAFPVSSEFHGTAVHPHGMLPNSYSSDDFWPPSE
jgi:hypothetical protein